MAAKRNWIVEPNPETGLVEEHEAQRSFLEAEAILRRLGGALLIHADREEVGPDLYETTRLVFHWESFTPPQRPEPEEPDDPELAEVPDEEPDEEQQAELEQVA